MVFTTSASRRRSFFIVSIASRRGGGLHDPEVAAQPTVAASFNRLSAGGWSSHTALSVGLLAGRSFNRLSAGGWSSLMVTPCRMLRVSTVSIASRRGGGLHSVLDAIEREIVAVSIASRRGGWSSHWYEWNIVNYGTSFNRLSAGGWSSRSVSAGSFLRCAVSIASRRGGGLHYRKHVVPAVAMMFQSPLGGGGGLHYLVAKAMIEEEDSFNRLSAGGWSSQYENVDRSGRPVLVSIASRRGGGLHACKALACARRRWFQSPLGGGVVFTSVS